MDISYNAKKNWYRRNYDKVVAKTRHTLLSGKWRGLSKRSYLGYCELCGILRSKHLHYHHWNDDEPSVGMWLCPQCHRYAEGFDKAMTDRPLFDVYAELKMDITRACYQARLL